MRLDDPRLAKLVEATAGLSAVVSFVEEMVDHRLFIAAALVEDGAVRHVHRKLFLPTYGLFDERRFFAAGDQLRAVPSRLGIGVGLAVCEDFWHLTVPQVLALDGAQILINVSSSPGRDLAATNEVGLGTATSWRLLMRTYAQLTTSFVVFCNRVGVDESISFWGGSEVIAPTRRTGLQRPVLRRGPVLRRHRPGRHPARADQPAPPARRAARTAVARARADRAGTGRPGRGHDRVGWAVVTETTPVFDLPAELAIDTDVARRVIGGFIQGQAAPGRLRSPGARPVGWHRFGPRGVPRRRGHRRRVAPVRADAVQDLIAGLPLRRGTRRGGPRAARQRSSTSARSWTAISKRPPVHRAPRRAPCGGATSWPGPGWRSCTTAP